MAVSEQTPYIEYTANGTTTSFALEFDCENQDHLVVLVDDAAPSVGSWSLSNNAVVFNTAPANGKKITIQRNTPASRSTNFQSSNNSFRPDTLNKDLDRIWLKLQELGVADMLLKIYVDRLHIDQKSYIDDQDQIIKNIISDLRNYVNQQDSGINSSVGDLRNYVDQQDSNLRNQINQQGVSLQQLGDYYNHLLQGIANIAAAKGWLASLIADSNGKNQQEVNNGLSTSSLKAIQNPVSLYYYNKDKQGYFEWKVGNYSAMVSLDKREGIYIPSNFDPSGSQGVWKRVFDGKPYAKWFGVFFDDTNLQDAVNVCKYFGGIVFEPEDNITLTRTTNFNGLNNFVIEANGAKISGTFAKPFVVSNSVKFKAFGFTHNYTGLSIHNSVLFSTENCSNISVADNNTNCSAITVIKNSKQVHIYKNNIDIGGLENQHLQIQGCESVYIYLNTFKNSLIDAIKIPSDVSNHIYIYKNTFENLGGSGTQGDCIDCYSGGVNVYIFHNTAINCRQLANLKKGDLITDNAPTGKIKVFKNTCINCGNLAQLWNVDNTSVVDNKFIHDGYTKTPASRLVDVQYATVNCRVEDNEFINPLCSESIIYVSGTPENLRVKGNTIKSISAVGVSYADIYLALSGGSVIIDDNFTSHPDTFPAIYINPTIGANPIEIWITKNRLHNNIRLNANITPSSFININENKIPSSVSRPIHNAITGDLPILNISDNSWQGHKRGSTLQRPVLPSFSADAALYLGQSYFDTTVGKPVFVKNTNPMQWVDATGTIV